MRVIIQRVSRASVTVEDSATQGIGPGLAILLGIARQDTREDADYLVNKVTGLRIFRDEQGKMNRSLLETGGAMLIVSNFTLYGDTRKGRRPSFDRAAPPEQARELYDYFVSQARLVCSNVVTGVFQAHMNVSLDNDGPITLICDSK